MEVTCFTKFSTHTKYSGGFPHSIRWVLLDFRVLRRDWNVDCPRHAQVTGYMAEDERRTWPTTQSLSDFTRRSCRPLADMFIADYFQRLWPSFTELKQRVNKDVFAAKKELTFLLSKLNEYQKSLTTGDDFVR